MAVFRLLHERVLVHAQVVAAVDLTTNRKVGVRLFNVQQAHAYSCVVFVADMLDVSRRIAVIP